MQMARALKDLLGSTNVEDFVDQFWERRALHVPRKPSEGRSLMGAGEFDDIAKQLITHSPGNNVFATRYDLKGNFQEAAVTDPHALDGIKRSGRTIVAYGIEKYSLPVARLVADIKIGLNLAAWPFVAAFCSARDGFRTHYDPASVFAIQIEGSKRWRVSKRRAVTAPLSRLMLQKKQPPLTTDPAWLWEDVKPPARGDFDEYLLKAGDVLYVPPGFWHQASALPGGSLHLSVGFAPVNFTQLLTEKMSETMQRNAAWRQSLPPAVEERVHRGALPTRLNAFCSSRLREFKKWANALTAADLHAMWRTHVHRFELPAPAAEQMRVELRQTDRLVVPIDPAIFFSTTTNHRGVESVMLNRYNKTIFFERSALGFVKRLIRQRQFIAKTSLTWSEGRALGWANVKYILERLSREEFLYTVPSTNRRHEG